MVVMECDVCYLYKEFNPHFELGLKVLEFEKIESKFKLEDLETWRIKLKFTFGEPLGKQRIIFILKDKQERFMSPDYCWEVIELVRVTIQILNW